MVCTVSMCVVFGLGDGIFDGILDGCNCFMSCLTLFARVVWHCGDWIFELDIGLASNLHVRGN